MSGIQLAEDLWDSLDESPEILPLSDAQAREIDGRLEAYRRDGDPGKTWAAVMERIDAGLKKRGE